MKKFDYLKLFSILFIGIFFFGTANAQKTVTVPGSYTSITAALTAEFALLSNDESLIINVGEGIFYAAHATNLNLTWPAKKLNITIQGAGADKTFQRAVEGRDARIATDVAGTRWMQLSGTAGMEGSTLTIKNMTFQYLGSFLNNPAAGAVMNLIPDFAMDVKFENVVFDNCVGIAVVNNGRRFNTLTVENCLFKECVTTPRRDNGNAMRGLIAKDGGVLTVRNTTFYSNENGDVNTTPSLNGFAIYTASTLANPDMTVILENNAFVNNKNVVEGYIALSPVVSLKPGIDATGLFNVTMKNNILIGNRRSGQVNDVDLFIINPDKLTWVESSANILNKAVKEVVVGEYESYAFAGSKVDETYTYTDTRINFVMEGALPKLTPDVNAIGEVSYSGDGGIVGVENVRNSQFRVYSYNRILTVEGLKAGDAVEVFNITGSLFSRNIARGDKFQVEMPKGLYFVRSGKISQKVLVH